MSEPLDTLLERLTAGDAAAAEAVFLAYEPYLRLVVRRQLSPPLRAKFDSVDVVQSVWVHLLQGFRDAGWRFADAAHLRAFLIRLTRHHFIDRLRHLRRTVERERPLGNELRDSVATPEAGPVELLQADETWEEILRLCPPAHREVLRLKREGALTAEVAARTGLHEGSVRRILNTVSRRLERRNERDNADRPEAP